MSIRWPGPQDRTNSLRQGRVRRIGVIAVGALLAAVNSAPTALAHGGGAEERFVNRVVPTLTAVTAQVVRSPEGEMRSAISSKSRCKGLRAQRRLRCRVGQVGRPGRVIDTPSRPPRRPGIGGARDQNLPFDNGRRTQVSQGNNDRYSHNNAYTRYGWDFALRSGATVRASMPGRVVVVGGGCPPVTRSASCHRGWGNHVVVQVADGSCARYAHLSALTVRVGQDVGRYADLGRSGNSGNSFGAHLHYQRETCSSRVTVPSAFVEAGVPRFPAFVISRNAPDPPSPSQNAPDTPSPSPSPAAHDPGGYLDGATRVGPGQVRVVGWAADADAPSAPVVVRALIDGRPAGESPAANHRSDVGAHGFDFIVPVDGGAHTICATVVNLGGGQDARLGNCFGLPAISTVIGDIDGDGYVGCVDLATLRANYGRSGPAVPGDLNADSKVDIADLSLLLSAFKPPPGESACPS